MLKETIKLVIHCSRQDNLPAIGTSVNDYGTSMLVKIDVYNSIES